jgi:APA family basic amino acid/polyamine antiporter
VDSHKFRAPLYPFLPAALVIGAFALVIYSLIQRPAESLYGAATVLSGIPLYYYWRKPHILSQGKS